MTTILYSGEMENFHHLPFHIIENNETIVFEQDILDSVCQGQEDVYQAHFKSSPNYFTFEKTVNGAVAFPLLAFINECINIFDHHVQAEVEGTREMTESLAYISKRVYPVVSAVAKIGAKVHFNDMKPGETPSVIFEREMRKNLND